MFAALCVSSPLIPLSPYGNQPKKLKQSNKPKHRRSDYVCLLFLFYFAPPKTTERAGFPTLSTKTD